MLARLKQFRDIFWSSLVHSGWTGGICGSKGKKPREQKKDSWRPSQVMTRCSCHPSHRLAWIHALGTLILPVTPPQARGAHSKGLAAVAGADLPSMRRDHRWLVVVMPPPTALAGRKVSCQLALAVGMVGPCGLVFHSARSATDEVRYQLGSRMERGREQV